MSTSEFIKLKEDVCDICGTRNCKGEDIIGELDFHMADNFEYAMLRQYDIHCGDLLFGIEEDEVTVTGISLGDGVEVVCLQCSSFRSVWNGELKSHIKKWHEHDNVCTLKDLQMMMTRC